MASTDAATMTTDVVANIAVETLDDQDALETYINELTKERLMITLLRATALRKWLSQIEKMAESRMTAEQILPAGVIFQDPDTQAEYVFSGAHRRECTDPEGFRAALIAQNLGGLAERAFKAAFRTKIDVMLTEIDRMAKFAPDTEPIVRDFLSWKDGPPHLTALEKETGR